MPKEKLNELLSNLHAELESQSSLDESSKELLEKIVADIKQHINPEEDDEEGLGASMEGAIHRFEESHPAISKKLNAIVDTLNTMGI